MSNNNDVKRNPEPSLEVEKPKRRIARFGRRILIGLILFVVVWILGDFIYSRVIAKRYSVWESNTEWDENGVIQGCDEKITVDFIEPKATNAEETSNVIISRNLFFLHGINDTPLTYRKIYGNFDFEQTTSLFSLRLPGFGERIDDYAKYDLSDWRQKLLKSLPQKEDKQSKTYLIAHSLGGALAIHSILYSQENNVDFHLDGLILLAPAIEVSNKRSPFLSTRFWHEFANWTLFFTKITESPFLSDTVDPTERDHPKRIRFVPRSVIDETFKLIDSNRGRASEIQIPTLMVIADKDQVNDNDAMLNFFNNLTCPKQLVRLTNSGHNMQVDYQHEALFGEIAKFIEKTDREQLSSQTIVID